MNIHVLEELSVKRELISLSGHTVSLYGETADKSEIEVLVTVKKKLDPADLGEYPNLKMIAVAFTGFDSVDAGYCRENNIAVYNVPAYSTNSVAELTLGLAISLLREIPKGNNIIRSNGWDLGRPGIELYGKTVGICGTGAIGIRTAQLFNSFGCEVIGWSRSRRPEFESVGRYIDSLDELCAVSDIISIHVPSNEETKGLIDEKQLDQMKSSAYLINTARGPIVDEKALYTVLKEKKIAGAALDVFSAEPIVPGHPFLSLDNVILTPHIAFKTEEALKRRAEVTLKNINRFINGSDENRVI